MTENTIEKHDFLKATVFAREISKPRVMSGSSSHRQQWIKVEKGYIIIEQRLYMNNKSD